MCDVPDIYNPKKLVSSRNIKNIGPHSYIYLIFSIWDISLIFLISMSDIFHVWS